jgi:hypothetical protein
MRHHLRDVCMTYAQHARLSLGLVFFRGAMSAVVHAFVPNLLVASSTRCAAEATARLATAGCRD